MDYVQDPYSTVDGAPPSFLIRLSNNDELNFNFTLRLRRDANENGTATTATHEDAVSASHESQVTGLTFVFASSPKELDNLITREFNSDPNLHKNPNVQLVGDHNTSENSNAQFNWTWKWKPPKPTEDRGGGWRTTCSFVEYNQRAHRLDALAIFSVWVQNSQRYLSTGPSSPRFEMNLPPRLRVPSSQSIESRISSVSDSEGEGSYKDYKEPQSPGFQTIPENNGLALAPSHTQSTAPSAVKVDMVARKPGEDPSMNEDGPLFRATMRSLEQKTSNMRQRMKKVLRAAEAAEAAQQACNQAIADFTEALREASNTNANAVRPALDHYFDNIGKDILSNEKQHATNLQKLIIDPISKLYNIEIKSVDYKKREFDEESKEYYAYVSKYLGQRSESLKEKKAQKSDEKYQAKRRTFELKRFDYSSFMHDLHGGRKDQEVLSHLTRYADAQSRGYLSTAKKIEDLSPQLEALVAEVKTADQDFQLQRSEREEKRRMLEKSTKVMSDDGTVASSGLGNSTSVNHGRPNDFDPGRSSSHAVSSSISQSPPSTGPLAVQAPTSSLLTSPAHPAAPLSTSPNNKFKGIRDLEENVSIATSNGGAMRKEGLLWALSRPGSHFDPKGINKAAWHKFWIVLDGGKLSEYVNWKDKLELHSDPIDLRMASVREARNSDRRFCFEVITPQYTRVYQAPSEEDMKSWIAAVNNALQNAFENRNLPPQSASPTPTGSTRKDIAAVLTGKSSSFSGHRQVSNPNRSEAVKSVNRYATTSDRPANTRGESTIPEAEPSLLLQRIRNADQGNRVCADCDSESKVDWCSINLGVLLCIECSGIHRSLGTHISKVRSLTLDTSVFTPDLIEILLLIGNRVSNMIWEAKLDRFLKPSAHSTREQRLHFTTSKYSERAYVQTSSQAPDDHLLTSIKRNDIQNVLHALALRANPNAHDRSRSTHAVFLALAAADPATPGAAPGFAHRYSSSTSTSALGTSPAASTSRPTTPTPPNKPFAIAELLLQNGADIPTEPAPFPLSLAAKQYLDFKNDQRLGRLAPYHNRNGATQDSNGDQLSALPSIAHGLSPSAQSARERERLLKRHSGSGSGAGTGSRPSRPSMAADAMMESFVRK